MIESCGQRASIFPESPLWKGEAKSHFDPISRLDVDLVVMNGPCLWNRLDSVCRATFESLYERGVKVGYLSAGMCSYSKQEADWVAEFMEEFPPAFVFTRDRRCYDLLKSRADYPLFNGLCTSMWLPEAHSPLGLVSNDWVVLNFDEHEPELHFDDDFAARVVRPKTRRFPSRVHGLEVVRTNNCSIDIGYRKIYNRPATYHSDLPWGYCSILAGAKTVYSERVHTCAAALAYGRAAQFVRLSSRSHEHRSLIFERLGVPEIFERPVTLDHGFMDDEKCKMSSRLKELLDSPA